VLRYSLPDQVLGFTLGEHALLPGQAVGDGTLWEDTIDRTAVLGLILNDAADQPAAIASRLIAGSADTDLLLRGVLLEDYWLLTIPGEGTLFLRVDTNLWPFLKHTLLPVWYFDQPWGGPSDFQPTVGPGAQSTAMVVGATGRFAGAGGSATELYRLTELDPVARSAAATGELHLSLLQPQVVAEQ
jgi:hypothetical protein